MIAAVVPFTSAAATSTVSSYSELESAVASAAVGDVINVSADITADHTITVNKNITITSSNKKITRSASFAGQIFYVTGELTLENITLDGNRYETATNALAVELINVNGGTLNLKNGATLTTNRADAVKGAGGVWLEKGEVNMYQGAVITEMHQHNNSATNQNTGIAVHMVSGTFNMHGGKISANDGKVGAVANIGGTINMYGGEIVSNIANSSGAGGGGVYNSGVFNMRGGSVSSNTSWVKGGGVFNAGTFNLYDGLISKNNVVREGSTECDGGGILSTGNLNIEGGTISSNNAQNSGGGVMIAAGTGKMSAGSVTGNTTTMYSGGGIFVSAGTFSMTGGLVSKNTAAQYGGGFAVTSDVANAFVLSGGEVYDNGCGASQCGADIYVTTATSRVLTTFGSGCIKYTLYIDNQNSRYSPSNAKPAPSQNLQAGYGYIYVTNGASHSFDSWVTEKEPACETTGLKYRVCKVCSEREEEIIPAKGHNTVAETTPPTCSENGQVKLYCPVCGYIHNIAEIPATGHIGGNWTVLESATAGKNGTKVKYCRTCDEIVERASFTVNDPIVTLEVSEPESKDADTNTVTVKMNIKNNPGIWGARFFVYYSDDMRISSVVNGGIIASEYIPEAAVNVEVLADSIATEIFNTSGAPTENTLYYCFYFENSGIDDLKSDGTLVTFELEYSAELEGDYVIGFAYDVEDIINSDGDDVELLFENAKLAVEPINPCEHIPGEPVTTPAKCEETGLRTVSCTQCGKVLEKEVLPATGHTRGQWTVTTEPTTEKPGEKTVSCTVCEKVLDARSIPSLSTSALIVEDGAAAAGGNAEVRLTVNANPGIWGIRALVYYTRDISLVSVSNGNVFDDECMANTELNVDPSTNKVIGPVFEKAGIDTSDIYAYCVYFEQSDFTNNNGSGDLAVLTFALPEDAEGEYTVSVLLWDAIDSEMNDVSFETVSGIITVSDDCSHERAEWVVTAEPNCTYTGTNSFICPDCGKTLKTDTLPTNGQHKYSELVVDRDATETEPGQMSRHCIYCDDQIDITVIPPTVLLGDVDGNGDVTAADALLLKKYLAGAVTADEINLRSADYNSDGAVNAIDLMLLRNAMSK